MSGVLAPSGGLQTTSLPGEWVSHDAVRVTRRGHAWMLDDRADPGLAGMSPQRLSLPSSSLGGGGPQIIG